MIYSDRQHSAQDRTQSTVAGLNSANISLSGAPYLEATGLCFRYRSGEHEINVLDGLDFHVKEGEVVSLLGPSGSGKTTIFNILSGILSPVAGHVSLNGRPVTGQRRFASYMFQDHSLLQWRTVLKNVLLPAELEPAYKSRSAKKTFTDKAIGLLTRFGLEKHVDMFPSELSGGMKQRAALARTFMADRPLYLFDEPFTGLDLFRRLHLEKMLAEFLHKERKTCMLITHDLETALALSHRVFLLDGPPCRILKVIEGMAGRPDETVQIRTQPTFREATRQVTETLSEIFESHAPEV